MDRLDIVAWHHIVRYLSVHDCITIANTSTRLRKHICTLAPTILQANNMYHATEPFLRLLACRVWTVFEITTEYDIPYLEETYSHRAYISREPVYGNKSMPADTIVCSHMGVLPPVPVYILISDHQRIYTTTMHLTLRDAITYYITRNLRAARDACVQQKMIELFTMRVTNLRHDAEACVPNDIGALIEYVCMHRYLCGLFQRRGQAWIYEALPSDLSLCS